MSSKIAEDHGRFRDIVRGKIRGDLKKYIGGGEMIGRKGKHVVSIPVPHINIPHFIYGPKQTGGVGQGEGGEGDPLAPGDQGGNGAGNMPGQHILEVDISLDELAELMGEDMELPRIEPRGKKILVIDRTKYTGIRRTGPESLRHFRRTYKEALLREVASGTYDEENPVVAPVRDDKRYRSWKRKIEKESNAVIFYMLDISGSVSDEMKEIIRITAFWLDIWIKKHYKGVVIRYIVHDTDAKEVDEHTFYHTRESGGTMISSAYKLCDNMIDVEFNPVDWNIYCFHFSDGDNWGSDNETCLSLLKDKLLKKVNLFCFGQVEQPGYVSRDYFNLLYNRITGCFNFSMTTIPGRDSIYPTIKHFLGRKG